MKRKRKYEAELFEFFNRDYGFAPSTIKIYQGVGRDADVIEVLVLSRLFKYMSLANRFSLLKTACKWIGLEEKATLIYRPYTPREYDDFGHTD